MTSLRIGAVVFLFSTVCASGGASQESPQDQKLYEMVQDTINHEVDAEAKDHSLWCFRRVQKKDDEARLFMVCQAKDAEIDRLLAVNGKALDEKHRAAEDRRIDDLLRNSSELKRLAWRRHEDGKRATKFLKLIPAAFVFQLEEKEGDRIRLKFTPNPSFHPSGHEGQVFHHMEGTLVLDLKQKRLAEISGRLNSEVKFGGGLFGHLDEGGTFLVKQQEVGQGFWELTTLDVRMKGKALFFKTINVQENEVDSEFKPVPSSVTLQQIAGMTKELSSGKV